MNLARLEQWVKMARMENEKAVTRLSLTRAYIEQHLPPVPVRTVAEYMNELPKQVGE